MSLNRSARMPAVPTLPKGEQIAAYDSYLEAQKAVDHLADKEFAVQHVTIVGTDLRMVERVTGRLSYPRVALAGLASGAWFGLFVGLLLSLFATPGAMGSTIFPAVAIGAAFGILFSVISYAFTGGKRDFTSSSQIVASRYAILCAAEHAHQARGLLQEIGGTRGVSGGTGPGQQGYPPEQAGQPQQGYPQQPGQPQQGYPQQPGQPQPGQQGYPGQPGYPPAQPPVGDGASPPQQPPTQPPSSPRS